MPRRLLIDETERTAVSALPQAIKQRLGERKPEAIIRILFEFNAMERPCGVLYLEDEILFNGQIAVINQISWANTIDAEQPIAGFEAELLTDRTRFH